MMRKKKRYEAPIAKVHVMELHECFLGSSPISTKNEVEANTDKSEELTPDGMGFTIFSREEGYDSGNIWE